MVGIGHAALALDSQPVIGSVWGQRRPTSTITRQRLRRCRCRWPGTRSKQGWSLFKEMSHREFSGISLGFARVPPETTWISKCPLEFKIGHKDLTWISKCRFLFQFVIWKILFFSKRFEKKQNTLRSRDWC